MLDKKSRILSGGGLGEYPHDYIPPGLGVMGSIKVLFGFNLD